MSYRLEELRAYLRSKQIALPTHRILLVRRSMRRHRMLVIRLKRALNTPAIKSAAKLDPPFKPVERWSALALKSEVLPMDGANSIGQYRTEPPDSPKRLTSQWTLELGINNKLSKVC